MGEKQKIIEQQDKIIKSLEEDKKRNQELYSQLLDEVIVIVNENISLSEQIDDLKKQLQDSSIPILSNTKNELTPFAVTVVNKIDDYLNIIKRKYRDHFGNI